MRFFSPLKKEFNHNILTHFVRIINLYFLRFQYFYQIYHSSGLKHTFGCDLSISIAFAACKSTYGNSFYDCETSISSCIAIVRVVVMPELQEAHVRSLHFGHGIYWEIKQDLSRRGELQHNKTALKMGLCRS
jgi:hypothetical protein